MFKKLSMAQRFIAVAFGLSATIAVALEAQSLLRTLAHIDQAHQTALNDAVAHIDRLFDQKADTAETLAWSLAANNMITRHLIDGDREALQATMGRMLPEWREQFAVGQIVFHQAPARPFLRVQKPERFGDDVSAARPDVVAAISQGRTVKGVSVGKLSGLGVRAVVPVALADGSKAAVDIGMTLDDQFLARLADGMAEHLAPQLGLYTLQSGKLTHLSGDVFAAEGLPSNVAGAAQTVVAPGEDGRLNRYAPLIDSMGKTVGMLALSVDTRERSAAAQAHIVAAAGKLAVILLIAGLAGWLAARSALQPLKLLSSEMARLASGDVSAAVVQTGGGPEFRGMEEALAALRKSAIERDELSLAVHQRGERVDMMIAEFDTSSSRFLTDLRGAEQDLAAVADEMSALIGRAADQVSGAAQSAKNMTQSIDDIAANTEKSQLAAKQTFDRVNSAQDVVSALAKTVADIGAIAQLIAEIAEQTNLLALNATIEAARAGDHGKGFAVVAQEVKSLAARTTQATDDIGKNLGSIQAISGQIETNIGDIAATVREVVSSAEAIDQAVYAQRSATDEIGERTDQAADGAQLLANFVDENATSRSIKTATRNISRQAQIMDEQVTDFLAKVRQA